MAVAKSYANLEQVRDPYTVNGREYVMVKMSTGALKQVRWYSDNEYKKLYGEFPTNDKYRRTQKEVLGFDKGYITIFKGNTYDNKEWFKEHNARYTRFWGWYIISTDEVPETLPEGVESLVLKWEDVGNGDVLKPESQVIAFIDSLIYEPSNSEYQGSIGDRLELTLTVDKNITLDGQYGTSSMHVMSDANGNIYTWITASKNWEEGSVHHIRGTVKDHSLYKANKQTVLTRCAEVTSSSLKQELL